MRVRMTADISGSRNGVDWPKRGEVLELPNEEAKDYLNSGLVEAVKGNEEQHAVPADDDVETATPKPSRAMTKKSSGLHQGA